MIKLIIAGLILINAACYGQNKTFASPVIGLENFSEELIDAIVFPESYYENGGVTLRVAVDSLANTKLVTIKPYDADFYSELKYFVEQTKWTVGTVDNVAKTQIISVAIKLNKDAVGITRKASPVEGMQKFFDGLVRIVKDPGDIILGEDLKAKFTITKDGEVKDVEFTPDHFLSGKDIKAYLRRTKWNPAYHNGVKVDSKFTLPIRINFKRY